MLMGLELSAGACSAVVKQPKTMTSPVPESISSQQLAVRVRIHTLSLTICDWLRMVFHSPQPYLLALTYYPTPLP